jgi:uncharacterized RDD family membrane protein YckC
MPHCANCGKELSGKEQFCSNCGAPVSPTAFASSQVAERIPPSPSLESGRGITLASWGDRFVAWLIDAIIIGAVSELFRLPGLSLPVIPFAAFGSRDLILFIYWTLIEGFYGQSIGKMVMRLRLTRMDGSPPTLVEAAIGSFGKAFLLPLDCIIGWLAGSCKENRQRLFTLLAKTIVTKT